jgi:BlaI family penicillinase repressor
VNKRPQAVPDAELAVLKILWRDGPQTAKSLTQAIYPAGANSEFASIHSFLQRLERKGLVTRDRRSAIHVFSAAASRADVAGSELEKLSDRLGDGSIAPLILHLLQRKRLTKKEAAEIRKFLDRYTR